MRVLILSCNTGEGHNSCAKAIKEVFDQQNIPCDIDDALRFVSPQFSDLISSGHAAMYRRCPGLFTWGYDKAFQQPERLRVDSALGRCLGHGTDKLAEFIRKGDYNHVLCVHPFAGIALTQVQRKYHLPLHTSIVATDYTCNPGTAQSEVDWYFSPDESLNDCFVQNGIPADRIIASGIPVRQQFYDRLDRYSAKESCNIDPAHKHLLVMGGSMGCGPLEKLVDLLACSMNETTILSVLASTNHNLKDRLRKKHGNDRRIRIYGFYPHISRLMDSADLLLTKPGGLSSSEAAVKGLPTVLIDAVAGCEAHNLNFFTGLGASVAAKDPQALCAMCLELLADDTRRQQMAETLRPWSERNAAKIIAETHFHVQ